MARRRRPAVLASSITATTRPWWVASSAWPQGPGIPSLDLALTGEFGQNRVAAYGGLLGLNMSF